MGRFVQSTLKEDSMSKIIIRRYKLQDIVTIVELIDRFLLESRGKNNESNHYKDIDMDKDKVYTLLNRQIKNQDFFLNVVIKDDEIVGGLCAFIAEPIFSSQRIAYDQIFYMVPEYSNLRCTLKLFKTYINWAKEREAIECRMCSSTKINQQGFTKLCTKMGFEQFEVGFARRF